MLDMRGTIGRRRQRRLFSVAGASFRLIGLSSFVLGLLPRGPCSLVDFTLLNDCELASMALGITCGITLASLKANSA
jgi:hypothetical protein